MTKTMTMTMTMMINTTTRVTELIDSQGGPTIAETNRTILTRRVLSIKIPICQETQTLTTNHLICHH
jgi:hypothetical protein